MALGVELVQHTVLVWRGAHLNPYLPQFSLALISKL
jgi:hypothetical protein